MPSFDTQPLDELAIRARCLGPYRAELGRLRSRKESFAREEDFRRWFEGHIRLLGFRRIIVSQRRCPDLVLEDICGKPVRVELERVSSNFRQHKHDPKSVDMVISIAGSEALPRPSFAMGREFLGKTRISCILPQKRIDELQQTAVEDQRSFNNQLEHILRLGFKVRNRMKARGMA
jgi:hypothetical protein